jgi:hypothetical protein
MDLFVKGISVIIVVGMSTVSVRDVSFILQRSFSERENGNVFVAPVHNAHRLRQKKTVFVRSNAGVISSSHTRGMYVCVRLFCVCADPPSKESYGLCIGLRN